MFTPLRNWLARGLADPSRDARLAPELTGRIRARQVEAIARTTPVVMIANVLNALAVLVVFGLSGEPMGPVSIWAAGVMVAAGWFLAGWRRNLGRRFPDSVSDRTMRRLVRYAAALGALWALPSVVLLPEADMAAQAFLVVIAAGMVAGGVTCFYPVPRAAGIFAGVILLGAVIGLAQASLPLLVGGLIVTASYFLTIRQVVMRHADIFVSEFIQRLELEDKNARIEALMRQTADESRRMNAEAMRRLEQAQGMESLGRLTGGLAHDLNNILSVIRGNAELQQQFDGKDDVLIHEIVVATERAADLIRKLLAYSRRQALRPTAVDPADALRDAAEAMREAMGGGVTVEIDAPAGLWAARADPGPLQAALAGLIQNALDAMPDGGTLTLSARNRAVGAGATAEVGHEVAPGDYVALSVRDTGVGMAPETAARAFEPFFTTKPPGLSAGMGLAMVLGFVRQSGGFVTLSSRPGEGAEFVLHLPREGAGAAAPERRPRVAPGAGQAVLLIEDDADVRRTVGAMLRTLNYAPHEAADAAAAETMLREGLRPALVLSDVRLGPGETGPDFARRLADAGVTPPFLFMSGMMAGESAVGQPPGGALRKPFSRDQLAAAISAAMAEKV
jgi:signal transduction histidine kinase